VKSELRRRCREFGGVSELARAFLCVDDYTFALVLFGSKGKYWWEYDDWLHDYLGCNLSKCQWGNKPKPWLKKSS
jgi:hypothetical protein